MISYAAHGKAVDAGEKSARAAHMNHVALDALALALTNHNHVWTPEERKLYEAATHFYNEASGKSPNDPSSATRRTGAEDKP